MAVRISKKRRDVKMLSAFFMVVLVSIIFIILLYTRKIKKAILESAVFLKNMSHY